MVLWSPGFLGVFLHGWTILKNGLLPLSSSNSDFPSAGSTHVSVLCFQDSVLSLFCSPPGLVIPCAFLVEAGTSSDFPL